MTNAATALPDWVGALISFGAAAALLALRAWIVRPWRGSRESETPERRRPLRWPTTPPSLQRVSPGDATARSSAGETRRCHIRGSLVQLRPAERARPAPPVDSGGKG